MPPIPAAEMLRYCALSLLLTNLTGWEWFAEPQSGCVFTELSAEV